MAKTTRVGKSLIQLQQELGTEEQCLAFLEALRWPDGVRCLTCDGDRVNKYVAVGREKRNANGDLTGERGPDRTIYQCLDKGCFAQFTATSGTIFNDSHLPLQKWVMATAIMCNAKKGVSAKQLQRDLATSYKTAWYLCHRIREAMILGSWADDKMNGVVEMDETMSAASTISAFSVSVGTSPQYSECSSAVLPKSLREFGPLISAAK
jgi:Transposase zinc-ribbon domain